MSHLSRLLPLCALVIVAAAAVLLPSLAQADKKAKGYALLVGVKDYDHSGLGKLAYPENDVEELAKLLDKPGSPFHKNVRVLTNSRGKKDKKDIPTAENIRKALEAVRKQCKRDDTVLVALAGHGMEWVSKDPDGKGEDRTYPFFCPTDADLPGRNDKKVYKTGEHDNLINLNGLMGDLGDFKAQSKLVLIDACRNEMKARGAKRSIGVKKDAVPRGVAVLFSCDSDQVAWESDKLKHGVFFHFVLEGLRGKAKNEDKEVTWDSLADYVTKRVEKDVGELVGGGAEQKPFEVRSLGGKSPLLLQPGEVKAPEKVAAKKAITNSIGMKLVTVPKGKFHMGSPKDEKDRDKDEPQHEVELTKAFYLGVYEVTQKQFKEVMGYNPSYFSTDGTKKEGAKYDVDPAEGKDKVKGLTKAEREALPVENVSWEEAVEFCKKLSALKKEKEAGRVYRLPSEAEWEYACRAGASSKVFHFGDRLSSKQANFNGKHPYGGAEEGDYLERTAKVGSYKPNAFGLYDMHGNVVEWCADWYDKDYYASSPKADPAGPQKGSARVGRGGGWVDFGDYCRSAVRGGDAPAYRTYYLGFRVALVPPGE